MTLSDIRSLLLLLVGGVLLAGCADGPGGALLPDDDDDGSPADDDDATTDDDDATPPDDDDATPPDDDDATPPDDDDVTPPDDDDVTPPDDDDVTPPDDDDVTPPDDDDVTPPDDDDVTPPDDDDVTTPDDDDVTTPDDDDATADDDDATPPEPDSFVGTTYCLDWTSITFSEPPNLLASLSVVGLTLQDYPLLAEPTAVDLVNDDIWFLTGTAQTGTCEQNLAVGTTDLTATGPGSYVDPHFEVGPMPFSITASVTTLDIFELEFTGDFTADHAQIINGTLGGELDITTYAATCGFLSWTCFPCTGNPSATCVYVAGTGGVWTDNGLGPLTPVP